MQLTEIKESLTQRICADYASGLSIRQLAAKWSFSTTTVRSMLVAGGVERRPRGGKNRKPTERCERLRSMSIAELYAAPAATLAAEHGVHQITIHKIRAEVRAQQENVE